MFSLFSFPKKFFIVALILGHSISEKVFSQQFFSIPANKGYVEPMVANEDGPRFNPDKDAEIIRRWTTADRNWVWYFHYLPGTYDVSLNISLTKGEQTEYMLSFNKAEDKSVKSSKLQVNGTGDFQNVSLAKVEIEKEGFYRLALNPVSKSGKTFGDLKSLDFKQIKGTNGNVRFVKWFSSPSVHLGYSPSDQVKRNYDWLYAEINVPVGYDPLYTFYMGIGFYRGYFGIQVNSETERRVLFSVWDSGNEAVSRDKVGHDNRVRLVKKGKEVQANDFGNEGTGGQSYRRYNWKTGTPMKFLMHIEPAEDNKMVYSAWFNDTNSDNWQFMATWIAPYESKYFDGFYSFLENFGNRNGQEVRKAEYFNTWGKEVNGDWIPFDNASMTFTDGEPEGRSDYGGGLVPNDSTKFYMSSGGYGEPVFQKIIKKAGNSKEPEIDFNKLQK